MTSVIKKVFKDVSAGINDFKNRYKLPNEFHNSKQLKIMHISDTPVSIYPHIYKMINYSRPDIIIHTGDLVDNLKLEDLGESLFPAYQKKSEELIKNLEKLSDARIIYIPGNHDNINIIQNTVGRSEILPEGSVLDLNGIKIGLAHYPENLPTADINLYGHTQQQSFNTENKYFNGILNMNYFLLPSLQNYKINYPWIVDQGRQYKNFNMI